MRKITATEAARQFREVLNQVQYRGEEYIVERNGQPACRITPVGPPRATLRDLVQFFQESPRLDEGVARIIMAEHRRMNRPSLPRSPWES